MQTRTMTSMIAMTAAALPLTLVGCGDLTEGGSSSSPGSIGKIMLVADVPPVQGEPVITTKRQVSTTGTGTIGAVTVTYYDLDRTPCDSPVPEIAMNDCPYAPDGVTIGPDGRPWYASNGGMVRIGEDDAAVKVRVARDGGFLNLASGGGAVWGISWYPSPGLLRFDPANGASDFYALPDPLARPTAAAVDGHGDVFVVGGHSAIVGRIDARRNVYIVAREDSPAPITITDGGLALGRDGAAYVSDYETGRVGRVNGGGFVWTDLGGNTHAPSGMAAAPDGSIWFVDLGAPGQAGRLDAAGVLQTFPLPPELQLVPTAKSASSIAVAPDGSAWFTVAEHDAVVRVTASGEVSYVSLEAPSLPRGLAIDANGTVWITTFGFARIDLGS